MGVKHSLILRIFAVVLVLVALALLLNALFKSTGQKHEIKFGYFPDMALTPLFVAKEKGFFQEENVDVELVSFGYHPENIIPAAVSGDIDGGIIGSNRIVSAITNNVKVRIVSSSSIQASGKGSLLLIVHNNSDIWSSTDLKGKKIGLMLGGPEEYIIDTLMKKNGLQKSDIYLTDVDFNQRVAAFEKGDFDAIFLQRTIYAKIKNNETRILFSADEFIENESVGAVFFSEHLIENEPEKVCGFIRAWYKAHKFINENPEAVIEILSNYTNEQTSVYKDIVWPYFPNNLTIPSEAELNRLIVWMKERDYIKQDVPYEEIVYNVYSDPSCFLLSI